MMPILNKMIFCMTIQLYVNILFAVSFYTEFLNHYVDLFSLSRKTIHVKPLSYLLIHVIALIRLISFNSINFFCFQVK